MREEDQEAVQLKQEDRTIHGGSDLYVLAVRNMAGEIEDEFLNSADVCDWVDAREDDDNRYAIESVGYVRSHDDRELYRSPGSTRAAPTDERDVDRWRDAREDSPDEGTQVLLAWADPETGDWRIDAGYRSGGFWYSEYHGVPHDPPPAKWREMPAPPAVDAT